MNLSAQNNTYSASSTSVTAPIELSAADFLLFLDQQIQEGDTTRNTALMMLDLRRSDRLLASADAPRARKVSNNVRQRMESVLRPLDRYTWVAPDCIWLALPALASPTVAVVSATKLLKFLEVDFLVEGSTVHMRPCIGIACYPDHALEAQELIETADFALQEARRTEMGYALYQPSTGDQARHSSTLEIELRQALQSQALHVHYQPQIDLSSGRCPSAEALVRWTRADGRAVSPALIAEIAENSGLTRSLTQFVLNTVLQKIAAFVAQGIDISISVNLSARMLSDDHLPDLVWEALQRWGVSPERLTFEVTESSIIHDIDHSIQMLQTLKALDVRLSIDDFGTGYSSLAYLQRFPLNELKIDRLFVASLLRSRGDVQIVRSVIDLAHNFDLRAVAEGVEDEQTLLLLRQLGCDMVQGFWFSRALPGEAFAVWWKTMHVVHGK
ncbi:MAG: GGDEF domain-containing protein [Burkholderiaceae bacterium]|nr:MAG: GGDEF domain-containing protein [Burkholderiaceae bacterium]